mgnify:CR=1 FL=1
MLSYNAFAFVECIIALMIRYNIIELFSWYLFFICYQIRHIIPFNYSTHLEYIEISSRKILNVYRVCMLFPIVYSHIRIEYVADVHPLVTALPF